MAHCVSHNIRIFSGYTEKELISLHNTQLYNISIMVVFTSIPEKLQNYKSIRIVILRLIFITINTTYFRFRSETGQLNVMNLS